MFSDIASKPPAIPAAAAPPAHNKKPLPSIAQFAINQQLAAQSASEKVQYKPDVKGLEVSLKSVAIFRDPSSGQYVTIFRDQNTGEIREQIPDERALELYARLATELQNGSQQRAPVNMEA